MFQIPEVSDLVSEGDVEQKLIYPLLVTAEPMGLGISPSAIITKRNIRRFTIGKGTDQKNFFPDYLIVVAGIPLIVIEAKSPKESVDNAFREARMYAAELNAAFPSGTNPVYAAVATNGLRLLAGAIDQAQPQIDMEREEFTQYSEKMAALQALIGNSTISTHFSKLASRLKPNRLWKPRRLLGGISIQQEEIGYNTFGATISADFAHIFNPVSREDRAKIARDGYIPSRRRERYVDPIDRVIRASKPPSITATRTIEDTGTPREIVNVFKGARPLEHQVLLIVGGVGVGKSTFIDYLREKALPRDVIDSTIWAHLNMNAAPISTAEIYDWLRRGIIDCCKEAYPQIDFDELETLRNVYSVEVNQFSKGIGKLFLDSVQFNAKLAEHLQTVDADLHARAQAYTRYCSTERGKLLIIILDNCDKRLLDDQLLMFQAAQWVQREFRALVILPLREETYDDHRNRPPLDTALKDLVFRIEPPLFHSVLVRRIQLALDKISNAGSKMHRYDLPNGFHVDYPAEDQAFYLRSILSAVFDYDRFVRRLIVGLAGRSIRRALEIFLEFCTSAHIGEDHIFKIRQSHGVYILPLSVVTRVLLRTNRRFYDSDHSYVKNLFATDAKDSQSSYFCRLMILRWLFKRFSQKGPRNLKGYFPQVEIINELGIYGIEDAIIRREIEYLAKAQCLTTEDFREEEIGDNSLIKLASAGFVHLEMLNNVDFLAAISEDTWFVDEKTARQIADRVSSLGTHYQDDTAFLNARDLSEFLYQMRDQSAAAVKVMLQQSSYDELTDLSDVQKALERRERAITPQSWIDATQKYPVGTDVVGTIVNAKPYGFFVELEVGITGLLHQSRVPADMLKDEALLIGEKILVNVRSIDAVRQRIDFSYAGEVEEA